MHPNYMACAAKVREYLKTHPEEPFIRHEREELLKCYDHKDVRDGNRPIVQLPGRTDRS